MLTFCVVTVNTAHTCEQMAMMRCSMRFDSLLGQCANQELKER